MAQFPSKAAAVEAYERESRENHAYHHALVASIKGELRRVGTVKDGQDTYIWQIAFTPRYYQAVVVQTFRSKVNQDDTVRVFWLADWKRPATDGYLWDSLYAEAQQMEREMMGVFDSTPRPGDAGALINDMQERFECSYEQALVFANCD